jgi:hypothetical protein
MVETSITSSLSFQHKEIQFSFWTETASQSLIFTVLMSGTLMPVPWYCIYVEWDEQVEVKKNLKRLEYPKVYTKTEEH